MRIILKEGDVFVLYRGFRDLKDKLEEENFKVLMPALKGERKQLSTKKSNESRFVTKVRWAVESVHDELQQKYRLLDYKIHNKVMPEIGIYFRITLFLNITFGRRFHSDDESFDEILQRIHNKKEVQNTLTTEVEENGWFCRKLPFKSVTSDNILDLSEITERDLKILFTGSYQLSQAVSYLAEMMYKVNYYRFSMLKSSQMY